MSSINNNDAAAQQARANFQTAQKMNNTENAHHAHGTHATNSTQGVNGDSYTQAAQGTGQSQGGPRLSQNAPIPGEQNMPASNDNGRAVGDAMGNAGGAGNVGNMALQAQLLDLQHEKTDKTTKSTDTQVEGENKKDQTKSQQEDQKKLQDMQLAALTVACPIVGLIMIAVEKSHPDNNSQNNDQNQNKQNQNRNTNSVDSHSMGHMQTVVGPDGQVQVQTGGGQQGGGQHGGQGEQSGGSRGGQPTQVTHHMQRPQPNSQNEQSIYNQGAGMLNDASSALNDTPQARKASQFG